MKSKILFCGLTCILGGVENYCINLSHSLNSNNYEIFFLIDGEDKISYKNKLNELSIKVLRVPSLRKKNYFKRVSALNKLFIQHTFSYVYYNTSFLHRLEIIKMAKRHHVPCRIVHSHNSNYGYNPNFFIKILEGYYRKNIKNYATELLACSPTAGNFTFGMSNVYSIIPNGILLNDFKYSVESRIKIKKEYDLNDKILIGHVGRLTEQKNPLFLVEILNDLVKINKDYYLIHIGEIQDENLYKQVTNLISKYNLQNNIKFLGKINHVKEFLNAFDFFLLPSLYEGFPISAVEAQANGLSCILSNTIDNTIMISDLCVFLSLNDTPNKWAKTINVINPEAINRRKYFEILSKNGYDLNDVKNSVLQILSKYKETSELNED